ncbi:alpha/beta hydrolase [Mycobacterium sp. ACS4331]|uniref:alpha/beta hydrolase n=1 Tax=Mycobacterium sp. ACS4331 TaxID=1834121 RepID=UPI001E466C38|nr:alpha/beta hydrolase [Mycobacterium sp. ACS4331]
MLRATAIVTAVTSVALGGVGCARVVDGQAAMAEPRIGEPVRWEECKFTGGGDVKLPPGAECGRIAVPVDYSKKDDPDAPVAQLAMIRFPATGQKIGSLVVNPGGPGESGIEAAIGMVELLPPAVREKFDFVGFDPRGVASSTPALWCNSDEDNDRLRAEPQVEYTPEGVAWLENETKQFIQRCVDKMGKEFLANVGTDNVAKDLDQIREALGDDKLTYLGYSYGTRIGSAYAEQFPQNVRAMILDGAVDPNADPVQADIDQAAAFQEAFNDYAADCAKDPTCPLGTDPAKAVDVYRDMVGALGTKSAPTKDPRGLSYSDAVVGTIMSLYSPALWRHLTQGLTELRNGRGDTLLVLADMYMRRDREGHYTNATDARIAINCVDQPAIMDRAVVIEQDRRMREVAPFMNYGEFTGDAPMSTCSFWPVPPTSEPHEVSVPDLAPTLVVSTTGDPATPYQAGVDLARQLGGGLITFEGTQHTVVFQGESCVDDMAAAYLIDGTLPPQDAKC